MSKFYKYSDIKQISINENIDFFSNLFFENLKKRLTKSYIFHVKHKENELEFQGSIFRFVWNAWDLFNTITKGRIKFLYVKEIPCIKFEIDFTETLVIALLFNIIPLFTSLFEPKISLIIFAAIWFLYILSYIITTVRFKKYIKKTLEEVKDISSY